MQKQGWFSFSKRYTTRLFLHASRENSVLYVLGKYCGGENMHKKGSDFNFWNAAKVKSLLDRQMTVQYLQVFRSWELSEVNLSAGDQAAKKTCVALFV